MDSDTILLETEAAMEKAVDFMKQDFAGVRTGKASPGLVENLDVEVYGSHMRLKQLALITTPEARLLVIQPFDATTVKAIEKGIKESRLGIMPNVDGKILRLRIPELSEERRRELVKTVKSMAEETRVRVRGFRRDGIDQLKKLEKAGEISEDNLHTLEKEVQGLTDRFVKAIDENVTAKEAEILKV
ncbi:MAG TPA: ribosome recycling factor [Chthoniobacteraceae bacterium]|nr:ribosome recycling factor [Chthoniobacteraceae bacterium]